MQTVLGIALTTLVIGGVAWIIRIILKVEPIKVYEQYNHHGRDVWVREDLRGQHRDHCLCYKCLRFNPGTSANCSIAQAVYAHCVEQDLVTPVWECPKFKEDVNSSY